MSRYISFPVGYHVHYHYIESERNPASGLHHMLLYCLTKYFLRFSSEFLVYTGCAQTHSSFKQSVVYRLSFHAHPPQDNAHRVDGVDVVTC